MAEVDFILQAVTTANHAKALQTLLALSDPTEILVSVAFVKESGLEAIEAAIKPLANKTKFFVGIRNDITSIQAIKRLLAMKIKLYAVDTGFPSTVLPFILDVSLNKREGSSFRNSLPLTLTIPNPSL